MESQGSELLAKNFGKVLQAPVAEGLDFASIEPFDVGEDGIGRGGEGLEILLGEVEILFVRYGYDYSIVSIR